MVNSGIIFSFAKCYEFTDDQPQKLLFISFSPEIIPLNFLDVLSDMNNGQHKFGVQFLKIFDFAPLFLHKRRIYITSPFSLFQH